MSKETLAEILQTKGLEFEPVKGKKEITIVRVRRYGKLKTSIPASNGSFTVKEYEDFEKCFLAGDREGFEKHIPKLRKSGIFKFLFIKQCDKLRLEKIKEEDPDGKKTEAAQKKHDEGVIKAKEHQIKKEEQEENQKKKLAQQEKMKKEAKELSDKKSKEKIESENKQIEADKKAHDEKKKEENKK